MFFKSSAGGKLNSQNSPKLFQRSKVLNFVLKIMKSMQTKSTASLLNVVRKSYPPPKKHRNPFSKLTRTWSSPEQSLLWHRQVPTLETLSIWLSHVTHHQDSQTTLANSSQCKHWCVQKWQCVYSTKRNTDLSLCRQLGVPLPCAQAQYWQPSAPWKGPTGHSMPGLSKGSFLVVNPIALSVTNAISSSLKFLFGTHQLALQGVGSSTHPTAHHYGSSIRSLCANTSRGAAPVVPFVSDCLGSKPPDYSITAVTANRLDQAYHTPLSLCHSHVSCNLIQPLPGVCVAHVKTVRVSLPALTKFELSPAAVSSCQASVHHILNPAAQCNPLSQGPEPGQA